MIKRLLLSLIVMPVLLVAAPQNLILIGQAGCGKGTFSQFFVREYGYEQICAGDIFREEIRKQTELGKRIEAIVARGDYVDDATSFQVVTQYVKKALENNRPFILDGYPRNKKALELLDGFLQEQGIKETVSVVYFEIDSAVLEQRILARVVCNNCHLVFNTETNKPKQDGVCDGCGHALEKRPADLATVVPKRIADFNKNIFPLIELAYNDYGYGLIVVDASCPLEDCPTLYAEIYEVLSNV